MKEALILLIFVSITFSSCTTTLSEKEVKYYTLQGSEIVQATQKSLSGHLIQNMQKGGVKAAVPFCNTMAIPLTQQMASQYDVHIKRVSWKIRNENNVPSKEEQREIESYKNLMHLGDSIKPMVRLDNNGEIKYYAPILTQKKCLTCHGVLGEELTKQTDSLIKSYYPNDKAIGFKEGDLRGIWSITFSK